MTKQEVILNLQNLSKKLNRKDIGKKEIRTVSGLENQLKKYFLTISEAVQSAGLTPKEVPDNFIKKQKTENKILFEKAVENASKKIPIQDNMWLGTAAEHYVLAELLYNGYNATRLPMDSGLDVFATKDGKVFYIQVKNLSYNINHSKNEVKIPVDTFNNNYGGLIYYVVVILNQNSKHSLVLPSNEIRRLTNDKLSPGGKMIRLRVKIDEGKIFLNNIDETYYLNKWDAIS